MKILLLDQFSDLGGAQQCLLELASAIRDRGWEAMAALPGDGELTGLLRALRIPTAGLACGPYQAGRKSVADAARFVYQSPRLIRQVERVAAQFQPELVYVNGPRLLPAAALAGLRAPVVFHSHSYLPPSAARRLTGAGLRRSGAGVIACCEFVAEPWRQFAAPERVRVIYNGVAGPPPGRSAIPRKGPVVGCIGRISPEKGQREFLQAAARIHHAIPECRFVIHGAPLFADPVALRYEAELKELAAGLPVEFRGWTADIYAALAGLDLLFVPSAAYEATTRVVLEAFSAGVPVVARRSGGIPEVVEEGTNGLLADSVDQLADCAIRLLTGSGGVLRMMGERARATWRRRFTLERYQQQLLDALVSFAIH